MNFQQPMTYDFPYSNPVTKLACGIGVIWLGFVLVRHAKSADATPQRRKGREGFTTNVIDHAIDGKNRVVGKTVLKNLDIPFYSRHNYNRRRRSKNFW